MKKLLYISLILTLTTISVSAKKPSYPISVDDIWGKYKFYERSVYGINWMNDGKYYTNLKGNKILQKSVSTGEVISTILDCNTFPEKINLNSYEFSANEELIILETEVNYIYRHSYSAVLRLQ